MRRQVLSFAARPDHRLAVEMGNALRGSPPATLTKKASLLTMSAQNVFGGSQSPTGDAALRLANLGMRNCPIHDAQSDDLYEINVGSKEQVTISLFFFLSFSVFL